ncbi:MAG: hypothetical protein AABZ47_13705 [Planctomycetota bacterium]
MVAETKERMTEMVETWTDGVKSTMDAGRRSQETMFKAMGEMWKTNPDSENAYSRGERMFRDFMPFVSRNMSTMGECFDSSCKAGMEVFKTACDTTGKPEETDLYRRSRQMWDTAFGAARTNFDAFNKAGMRMMENFNEFFRAACGPECGSRPTPKATK